MVNSIYLFIIYYGFKIRPRRNKILRWLSVLIVLSAAIFNMHFEEMLAALRQAFFNCIHSKNKPPAMQVCPQTALASSKKPPLL